MEKVHSSLFRKGERTKNAIVDSAIELFFEQGFHHTTLQMIADQVEIKQPAIYAYFADKEALLAACCMKAAASGRVFIDKGIDQRATAMDRLKSYISGNLSWTLEFPEQAYSLLAMNYFGVNSAPLRNLHKQIDKISLERLEVHLLQGAREGQWPEADLPSKARTIHNLLVGEIIKTLHWPVEMPLQTRILQTWTAVLCLLK